MYVSVRDRPAAAAGRTGRVATTVVLLGVVSMFTDISSEMVAAVLPLYLTTAVGLGYLAYGLVDGIYQGVSAVVRIGGGYAADRGGHPKWIALVGYGVSAVSRIALLPAHGFAAIAGVISADRLGKGLRTAPRDAIIAESSDPAQLGRSFGVHRTLDTIGAALGPLIAFAVLALVPGSYDSVFVVSFAFAVVGFAVLVLFVPDVRTRAATAKAGLRQAFREISGTRLRRPLLATGLLGMLTVGDGFLYLAVQQRDDLTASFFPLLYVGTNVAYLIFALPLGRLADRIGRARVFVGGHVALLAAYLAAGGQLGGLVTTVLVLLLLGTYYAATDGVLPALVSRLVSDEVRGSGIAAAQTVVALSRFVSALAFGSLWVLFGRGHALLVVGLLLAVALPFAWRLMRTSEAPA
ncbi:MFS transporter [Actinoplanes sp. TRM 88003]|uniref:MFS transporter n=1 Tax=Paractinoplanes aksuensis TaxID=2939490 RepID=A0ABT1DLP3_9ACTN|nr:MFS transporter [Actinoplanes aksuensis]MCO8271763.1 MFS transporter [Actinoplanes aksuensis]